MSNPITPAVQNRIEEEMPAAKAEGVSIAVYLKDLFAHLSSIRQGNLPILTHFSQNTKTTSGLTFGYNSGLTHLGTGPGTSTFTAETPAGTVALADNATNYIELEVTLFIGTVSVNQAGFSADRLPVFEVVTLAGEITQVTPKIPWPMILDGKVIDFANIDDVSSVGHLIRPNQAKFTISPADPGGFREITIELGHPTAEHPVIAPSLFGRRAFEVFLADTQGGYLSATVADGGMSAGGQLLETLDTGRRIRCRSLTVSPFFSVITVRVTHSVQAQTWHLGVIVDGLVFYSTSFNLTPP
ncbi:MAG: hypothetical protein MI923_16215 [Phycisphaerales bacterium]|nr:hypothetical protein [Phycisphaerales bacterium]